MSRPFFKDYKINIYDVDSRHYCKFSTLASYLWDVVITQSDALGETTEGFVKDNIWVLLKYDINIYKYPKFNDIVSVSTEVIGTRKFYGYRNYTIKSASGELLAQANSTAILIDFKRRRPMKITPEQLAVYGLKEEIENPPILDDLNEIKNINYSNNFLITYSDTDSNNHVNNVKYMEMAVNTLPVDIINNYDISNIKVLFKKETSVGTTVTVSSEVINISENTLTTIHTIFEEKLLTKLEFSWTRAEDKTLF